MHRFAYCVFFCNLTSKTHKWYPFFLKIERFFHFWTTIFSIRTRSAKVRPWEIRTYSAKFELIRRNSNLFGRWIRSFFWECEFELIRRIHWRACWGSPLNTFFVASCCYLQWILAKKRTYSAGFAEYVLFFAAEYVLSWRAGPWPPTPQEDRG